MTVFLTSMPKSGTHLVLNVLEDALRTTSYGVSKAAARHEGIKKGVRSPTLLHGHIRADDVEVDPGVQVVALVRDPRDVVLSMRDYLLRSQIDVHEKVADQIRDLDDTDQLIAVIDGLRFEEFFVGPVDVLCGGFLEWTEKGGALIRYEDVISADGHGSIASAIGRPDLRMAIRNSLMRFKFRNTRTFSQGGSRWPADMPRRVQDHLRQTSNIVESLGYMW